MFCPITHTKIRKIAKISIKSEEKYFDNLRLFEFCRQVCIFAPWLKELRLFLVQIHAQKLPAFLPVYPQTRLPITSFLLLPFYLMSNCPLCQSENTRQVFYVAGMPVFPNMVFSTATEARQAPVGDMTLMVCDACGFVFNETFEANLLDFNQKYDNEQKHSAYYQQYLQNIIELLRKEVPHAQKVAEIGCGKGHFLELMLEQGFDAIGFDPTYEGENPKIVKDYFSDKYSTQNADLLVMRHMLYTVINPFELLHTIAKANHYKGKVYIEVLDFEWIANNNSFCDICYEQVVYFTRHSLASFFTQSTVGNIFGGQYLYLVADLQDLKPTYTPSPQGGAYLQPNFEENVAHYKALAYQHQPIAIWGAGGKGVSFTHLIDAGKGIIPALIDLNPQKQNGFIAPHAQPVLPPEVALAQASQTFQSIFIVNPNYLEEIKQQINNPDIQLLTFA
jgi:hypothetical protein